MADAQAMGFTLPQGDDLISNGDDAISNNAQVTADLIVDLKEYGEDYSEEVAAGTLANDYVRGRAIAARTDGSVWRHTTQEGELLPLGYGEDGHLDAHAKRIWKQDIVHTTEVGRHPVYAHAITDKDTSTLLFGIRWDGGIDAPGQAASKLSLDTLFPVVGHAVTPTISEENKWTMIGSSSSQHFGAAVASRVAALGVQLSQMGKSGEGIEHIEARWGSSPALLTVSGDRVPVTGSVVVTSENMPPSASMRPFVGTWSGIQGTLSSTATTLTFTRTSYGTGAEAPPSTPFYPQESVPRLSDLLINDSGKNSLSVAGGAAQVIAGTHRMLQHLAPLEKRFVVIDHFVNSNQSPTGLQATQVAEVNAAYYASYGDAVVRRSDWLAGSEVWAQTGITPTAEDLTAQANRLLPPSLSLDAYHMNDTAHIAFYTHVLLPKLTAFGWTPKGIRRYTINETVGRSVSVWDYLNNREQVIYSDTGWRLITNLLPTGVTASNVWIRRQGNDVTVNIQGLITPAGTVTLFTLANGYRPDGPSVRAGVISDGNSTRVASPFGSSFRLLSMPGSGSWDGSVTFTTNNPLPTVLMGVAA